MKGSVLMGGILGAAALMAGGMWYAIQVAPYGDVVTEGTIKAFGEEFEVENYRAIDSANSPIKFRACFEVPDWAYNAEDTFKDEATPLVAPGWFDCFDARQISNDLRDGVATALMSNRNEPFGTTTFIAHYPDGQAFMWRQLNECGEAFYAGEPVPAECPRPEGATQLADVMVDPEDAIFDIKLTPVIGNVPEKILITTAPKASFTSDGKSYAACFTTSSSIAYLTETYQVAENAEPVPPVGNLPCFDADQLVEDIVTGNAVAFLGNENIIEGYDRIVAFYDDGRGFAWHQRAE